MRLLLIYVLFFAGTVFSIISPVYASCFYAWNNIFRPLDFSQIEGAFSSANYVTGCLAFSIILNVFRGKYQVRINSGTVFILLFLGWSAISTLLAPSRTIAWEGMILALKYLTPLVFISMAFRTLRDIEIFGYTMAMSVGVWSAQAGLHGILIGKGVIDMGIPGAQMSDRNDFIVGVLIAIPLLVYMARYYDWYGKKIVRSFLILITILSVIAVPVSLSRGGMVGLACTILFATMISRKRFRNFFILLAFIPILYFGLPSFVYERLETIQIGEEQSEASAQARLGNMRAGLAMTADYPYTGVGPYAFLSFVKDYAEERLEPHSIWIKASAELGVIGLALYVFILIYINWKLFRVYKNKFQSNRRAAHLAIAFISCFIGFNAAATFSNKLYSEYQWMLIATAGAFLHLIESAPRPRKGSGKTRPGFPAGPEKLQPPVADSGIQPG